MALFRRFFYKKPPDRLLEISERVYVFDCCFSSDVMGEDEYKVYLGGIVAQLQDHFPDASFMVFNFREGEQRSQISDVLSQYDMTVMDYPRQYESCPLLPLEMIHHFLKSSESWLSLEGQQNVLLMHCERGGWPVLAFMLSGLLLYRKQYQGEQKTLEMVHKQAPKELLHLLSPLNPQPSQLRYLQYISRRNLGSDWPPSDTPLLLDCLILRDLPHFQGRKGCRPILRVYGQDPKARANRSSVVLFSTPKTNKHTRLYQQEECILVKLDVQCRVQGDVVVECIHLHDDLVREEMIFRIMFHTAFVRANILMIQRDEMDILWDAKDQFPKEFKAEVLFSGADAVVPTIATAPISDDENDDFDMASPEEFFEVEEIFSDVIDGPDHKKDSDSFVVVDTASDDSEGKEVWKGDVDPNAFLDCASDDSNHKHDLRGEASTDPVKDITVDDVQYRSDGKADSNIDSVKDIGIDDGDEQRKRRTMEAKENDSTTEVTQHKGDGESNDSTTEVTYHKGDGESNDSENDLEPTTQKRNTNLNNPISEKTQATLRKQVGANAKLAGDSLKPKSKQQETQGPNVRMAKPNAVSRWIPSNKGSYKDSMHVAYPPTRINSAPAAITTSVKDGKRATSPDGVIPKDAKTKYLRASVSSPDMRSRAPIYASPDSSPKEKPPSLPLASPHQAPPPPQHPPSSTALPSLASEAASLLNSSQAAASPPPPPPPPPPLPTYSSPSQNDSHSKTSRIPPPPPPPPPPHFASERPNSGTSSPKPLLDWVKVTRAVQGTLWDELQRRGEEQTEPIFDASEIQSIFSVPMPKPQVVRLIDLRRANSMEVLLTKVKMPLPDLMAAVLAMDDTVLDVDQIKSLIRFKRFPTKEEMETLKNYTGDKAILGKCEQFLLELMKVPRVEYKLKVFSFKIQFDTQITEHEKRLNVANSASEKVRSSEKLKQIMKHILYLGNTLNQGTPKGSAVGFKLETLLKLSETFAPNINMTLMHYLCKVLASKAPHLLDFHKDLQSLESVSEIKMKSLAEETQAIYIGMERVAMELYVSESDDPVFQVFRQKLKDFLIIAETRVATVLSRYYVVGKDADALVYYFGENPYLYPFEKVAATLLKFVNLFKKAHEENVKQAFYRGPGAFGSSPPPPPPPPPSNRTKPT
uniref:Formin-like protein n=1 Tax=Noccaea caerulescens TaxID=107243 RepID=A0A1J3D8K4_NOCCA